MINVNNDGILIIFLNVYDLIIKKYYKISTTTNLIYHISYIKCYKKILK